MATQPVPEAPAVVALATSKKKRRPTKRKPKLTVVSAAE